MILVRVAYVVRYKSLPHLYFRQLIVSLLISKYVVYSQSLIHHYELSLPFYNYYQFLIRNPPN